MKSSSSFLRIAAVSLTISLASLLGACGQSGPLYLPTKPAVDTSGPAPASNATGQNTNSPKSPVP